MDKIRIACDVKHHLNIDDLTELQSDLKSLSKSDYLKLREEIVNTGFAFPLHVWRGDDDKIYLLGGHQRLRVLKTLRETGEFEIPPIPVVYVEAINLLEAKRRVLQDASQYGTIERQGLYEFVEHSMISADELMNQFKLPEIDLEAFKTEFYEQPETKEVTFQAKVGAKELSEEEFQKFDHVCPRCQFHFNDSP